MTLNPPSAFPPTVGDVDNATLSDGAPYSTTAYSALIDGNLIRPQLQIVVEVRDDGGGKLFDLSGYVSCAADFTIFTMPFYFFGASEATAS